MDIILNNVGAYCRGIGVCTVTVVRYNRRQFNVSVDYGHVLRWTSTSMDEVMQQLKKSGVTLNP